MIRAEELTKSFGDDQNRIHAVNSIDLDIQTGERVALIGRSGSGKTTLLNLLAGLDSPTSGKLSVDNFDLASKSRKEMAHYRAKTIGVIFQAFQLIPQRTAFQNIELPMIVSGVSKSERKSRVLELLERVGLSKRSKHRPSQLSGGEQQRVAIARALANQPKVLLADEPTGNLDSATANSIVELILKECQRSDITFVLVTHDDDLAESACTRTLRMRDGILSDLDETKKGADHVVD